MNYLDYLETPLGTVEIHVSEAAITAILFTDSKPGMINSCGLIEDCKQQLKEYFNKQRSSFNLPLAPQGTAFQQSTWQALLTIPFGRTASYREIAQHLNKPKAVRAVGAANGKNPIAIVVPCHRIIGSNGSLTGYAYGLERKQWLLKHEGSMD